MRVVIGHMYRYQCILDVLLKQWIVLFRKKYSYTCNGVCIQIEYRSLARYENLLAHTVAVIRVHLSKKNNPLLIHVFTFLKHFLRCILIYFNHY